MRAKVTLCILMSILERNPEIMNLVVYKEWFKQREGEKLNLPNVNKKKEKRKGIRYI